MEAVDNSTGSLLTASTAVKELEPQIKTTQFGSDVLGKAELSVGGQGLPRSQPVDVQTLPALNCPTREWSSLRETRF